MAAVCAKVLRPSLSVLRLCGSTSASAFRCLESTDSIQQSTTSNCFHSSALMLGGRKRSEWRQDRVPAHTRLRLDKPEKIKVRKAFGGHKKIKGIKIKTGIYSCDSLDVEFECPILKVVHNTANDNFNKLGIMVKGTIVEVDSNPFKTWYTTNYNKDEEKENEANSSLEQLLPYMDTGKLYAKITTRPGQVGACNGYILEGEELETLLNTRQDLKVSLESRPEGQ